MDTVLAFSNGITRSIRIPAQAKRICLKVLRRTRQGGKAIYMRMFAAALFMLLGPRAQQIGRVVIDIEYEGREAEIKARLIRLAYRHNVQLAPRQITFRAIGKSSPAHHAALAVFRGETPADLVVRASDLLRVAK